MTTVCTDSRLWKCRDREKRPKKEREREKKEKKRRESKEREKRKQRRAFMFCNANVENWKVN